MLPRHKMSFIGDKNGEVDGLSPTRAQRVLRVRRRAASQDPPIQLLPFPFVKITL